nr:MAG TPA: hypothetical protein [Caudoviricetes sp.]
MISNSFLMVCISFSVLVVYLFLMMLLYYMCTHIAIDIITKICVHIPLYFRAILYMYTYCKV